MSSVMMRVDERFKNFVQEKAEEKNLTHAEVTRRIVDRMTGESLFEPLFGRQTGGDSFGKLL